VPDRDKARPSLRVKRASEPFEFELHEHLGFVPFGPIIGTREAPFQPMMLTLERFRPRADMLFERGE
jgi:hypothetical protein